MSYIQVRVEETLKEDAIKVFEKLGLDLSTAIRLFLKKCVDENNLPFNIISENNIDEPDSMFEVKTKIFAPQRTSPYDILDEINIMCSKKNWICKGGGVKFQSNYISISKFEEGKMYYCSDEKIDFINEGTIITPCRELAIISKLNSSFITISEPTIFYDAENKETYLYEIEEPIVEFVDYSQYENSAYSKGYEYILKRKVRLKCLGYSTHLNKKI